MNPINEGRAWTDEEVEVGRLREASRKAAREAATTMSAYRAADEALHTSRVKARLDKATARFAATDEAHQAAKIELDSAQEAHERVTK
jgi:hypothetical protein